jgi:hypothetical protein
MNVAALPLTAARPSEAVGFAPTALLVPPPIAVRKLLAESALTVLSALIRGKVMALGFVRAKKFPPTVDAPTWAAVGVE